MVTMLSSPRIIKASTGGQQRVDLVQPSGTEKRPRMEKKGFGDCGEARERNQSGKNPVIKRPPNNLSSSSSFVDWVSPTSPAKISTIKISKLPRKQTIQNTTNSQQDKSFAIRAIHTTFITPRGSKPYTT